MKRLLSVIAGVAAGVMISAMPASAQSTVVMTATLTGGEETPALIGTGAVGTAAVAVDVANEEISVTLTLFNLPTTTSAGHIHIGPRGVGGPVVVGFPTSLNGRTGDISIGFRLGVSAFIARPEIGINTMADAIQAIILGNAYVNVHTTQNPGGEIRGQLSVVR